jgi:HSP20 family molecular chaperone IbpA
LLLILALQILILALLHPRSGSWLRGTALASRLGYALPAPDASSPPLAVTDRPPSPGGRPPSEASRLARSPFPWIRQDAGMFRQIRSMQDQIDGILGEAEKQFDLLADILDLDTGWDSLVTCPAIDMREGPEDYVVVMSLPAVKRADVSVTLQGRVITVAAPVWHPAGAAHEPAGCERRIQLPGPVADDRSPEATLTNGVLRVVVPKARGSTNGEKALRIL